ncbi:MAG: isochorismatase [Actinomycetota bacterium]
MSIELTTPYQTRPIRCLETWEQEGWRVKVYGISALAEVPAAELVDAIKDVASSKLPQPPMTSDRYGVGFLYAHQGGNGGGFASVNWWANENELFHHQYESAPEDLSVLRPVEETGGSSACVWDLAVMAYERQAWVDCVLKNDAGPDLESYLHAQLKADL